MNNVLKDITKAVESGIERENDKRSVSHSYNVFANLMHAYTRGMSRDFNGNDAMNIQMLLQIAKAVSEPVPEYDSAIELATLATARAALLLENMNKQEQKQENAMSGPGPVDVQDENWGTWKPLDSGRLTNIPTPEVRSGPELVKEMLDTVGGDWTKMEGRTWLPHWTEVQGHRYNAEMLQMKARAQSQKRELNAALANADKSDPRTPGEDLSQYFKNHSGPSVLGVIKN